MAKTYNLLTDGTWFERNFKLPIPEATTATGWHDWHEDMKKEYPIRYFVWKTIPRKFHNFVYPIIRPYGRLKDWFNAKYIWRHNIIEIESLPTGWHDSDQRIFYGMFDILVQFVEHEKAWMEIVFDPERRKLAPRWRWRRRNWRNRELGLAHLDWEISLNDKKSKNYTPHCKEQAKSAKEIKELYLWYTDVRLKKENKIEDAMWNNLHSLEKEYGLDGDLRVLDLPDDHPVRIAMSEVSKFSTKNDQEQYDEDTKMLTRLIKIRSSLWT